MCFVNIYFLINTLSDFINFNFSAFFNKLSKENNITMVQLAQAFVNSRPFVTSNIIGATTMDQLKTNIESVNINLTNDVIDEINEVQKIYSNPCP